MAALRSLEADEGFCEQMVEYAQASSFRNRWDRDRLRFWEGRLRATRAALTEGGERVSTGPVETSAVPGTAPPSVSPAPLAAHPEKVPAQPKNTAPAPTLFDKEAA